MQASLDEWVLSDAKVSESKPHADAAGRLEQVLDAWIERSERELMSARNLAIRWDGEHRQLGIDPDVCVLEPPPPEGDQLQALCYWRDGNTPPAICFEVVSKNHPHKDYAAIQDRYAMVRTPELVIFDPGGYGPKRLGGPKLLQLWRLSPAGIFERVHAGDSPAYSEQLQGWLQPTLRRGLLEISSHEDGSGRWLTEAERAQHAAKEARHAADEARAMAQRERQERERVEQELAELRRERG